MVREEDRAEQPAAPAVSVVVTFGDPRGRPEYLASWTRGQTLAAERFEVVAVVSGGRTEEEAMRRHLRPQDQLVRADGANRFEQYDVGVRAARGPVVFLTEDHCVAERGCLEAVVAWFADPAREAASIRWADISTTPVGRLEGQLAAKYTPAWYAEGSWNRVRIRGFAIRRAVYEAAGRYEGRYGEFGEAVLAARLHARGCRVDLIPTVGVRHVNQPSLKVIADNAWGYTCGECQFADECPEEGFSERYFSTPSLLRALRSNGSQAVRQALAETLVGRPLPGEIRRGPAILALAGQLARQCGGAWRPVARALWAEWWARARLSWWRGGGDRGLRAFEDCWNAVVDRARAVYAARHPLVPAALAAEGPGSTMFEPGQIPGPYPVEVCEGRPFLWTGPEQTLWLRLAPGTSRVELDTLGLRGPAADLPLWIHWNGRRLGPDRRSHDGGRVVLRVDAAAGAGASGERLDLVIPALPTPGSPERRRLGLPLGSIRVTPEGA